MKKKWKKKFLLKKLKLEWRQIKSGLMETIVTVVALVIVNIVKQLPCLLCYYLAGVAILQWLLWSDSKFICLI